ncbi:DUF5518 domain-containing protein [Natrinema sp. LN54]|uniref:DUF5518 domain-containing protein n=1 Tax=Natrinema sp. LN54 TaxID=3458705 RepID=UPI004036F026
MASSRTLINAIIGAVVGVVLSFIPFSTVLAGAIAGFLEGPDGRAGAIAGTLAGAITFLPIAGGAVLVFGFLGLGLGFGVPFEGVAFLWVLLVGGMLFLLFYTVGPALLGGYLGAYLAREYPDQRRRTRETIRLDTGSRRPSRPTETTGVSGRERDQGRDRDRTTSGGLEGDRYPDRERDRERGREPDRES